MQAAIEVEKKFTAPDCAWLAKCVKETGGTDIGKKSFTDVYYDTAACVLTRKDIWLRCRDGAWELKLPVEEECAHFLTKTELIRMRESAVRSHLASSWRASIWWRAHRFQGDRRRRRRL